MVFLSFFTANTLVEESLPEYVTGVESVVQVCSCTDLLKNACPSMAIAHVFCPDGGEELHRLLDGAREDSVPPSLRLV